MFSRSNATSPIPSLTQDRARGQITLDGSHFVANHEYLAQQLLDFILEARNQAKTGASPTKIALNYRFLDAEAEPRFPADIIAEWVDFTGQLYPNMDRIIRTRKHHGSPIRSTRDRRTTIGAQ